MYAEYKFGLLFKTVMNLKNYQLSIKQLSIIFSCS